MNLLKRYQVCMGHSEPIWEQCRGCKDDEMNMVCPKYRSAAAKVLGYRAIVQRNGEIRYESHG